MSFKPSTPLQDALDYACERGRANGGWPLSRPELLTVKQPETNAPATIHLNGEGLDGVKRDTFRLAWDECRGNMSATAKRLKVNRQTAYQMAKKYLLVLGVLLAGCASPKPLVQDGRALTSAATWQLPEAISAEAHSQSIEAMQATMQAITLAWDASPSPEATGYRIYHGPAADTYTNSTDVGNVTNATLLLPDAYQFYAATAYNASGDESPFSNQIHVSGIEEVVVVTATDETSPDTIQWESLPPREVYRGTNAAGAQFFRSRLTINRNKRWVTE